MTIKQNFLMTFLMYVCRGEVNGGVWVWGDWLCGVGVNETGNVIVKGYRGIVGLERGEVF
jgi:hypothetical protein